MKKSLPLQVYPPMMLFLFSFDQINTRMLISNSREVQKQSCKKLKKERRGVSSH